MDSRALVVLWLVFCVCSGCLLAVCIALVSHGKKLRIMQQYMHDAPLLRFAGIEGDVALARMRCADMQQEINGLQRNVDRQRQRLEKVKAILEAEKRTDGSEAKLVSLALADRIDALSARLDAVELACGIREKPKTMEGMVSEEMESRVAELAHLLAVDEAGAVAPVAVPATRKVGGFND